MPRPTTTASIQCEFFNWRLFSRDDVWYADGRGCQKRLGKHSLGTRDLQDAREKLRQLDRAKAIQFGFHNPEESNASSSERVTVSAGWDHHMRRASRPEVSGGTCSETQKRYRAVRTKHEKFCAARGVESWNEIDKEHILNYGTYLQKKEYADRSLYLELTTLKSVQKLLILDRKLPEKLRIYLSLRRPQGSDTYCFTPLQVRTMIARCKASKLDWLGHIIQLLACTGLRIGELATLRWSDIHYDTQKVPAFIALADERASSKRKQLGSARRTKGRRGRTIPIHPSLREILAAMPHHADGKLLHGPLGGRLKPDTVRNIFIREVIAPLKKEFPTPHGEVGFADARLHSLRHYFVSQAFVSGASEGEVKDWVGHRDSRVVEHYRHLSSEDSRRKMEQLDLLGDRSGQEGPDRDQSAQQGQENEGVNKSSP